MRRIEGAGAGSYSAQHRSIQVLNSPSYIQRKRRDYRESGVIQVWIDPEKRFIELVYPDRPLQYFQEGEALTIAGVLEFALEVKSLFAF